MDCSLEDDVTSGPAAAAACYERHAQNNHHLLQRDPDELMLLCDEQVDDYDGCGVVENTSSSASSSRDDVNLSSRAKEAACGGAGNGEGSHSNTATTALLLGKDAVVGGVEQPLQQPVEDDNKDERKEQQQQSLYGLRRNPKRSQRFIDEEFALEISAGPAPSGPKSSTGRGPSIFNEKARACTECGKEFSSWKALFGHMRCHPEREWRGIQKPVSIHQLAAKSGIKRSSSKSTKSRSQAQAAPTMSAMSFQEDRAANSLFKVLASDDESDTESIEAAYMNGGGFFSSKSDTNGPTAATVAAGKITGKRSKRQRTTNFLQQEAVSADMKEERDMANCLVMLASAGQKSSEEEQEISSGTIELEDEDEDQLVEEMNNSGGELEEEKQNTVMLAIRGGRSDVNSNSPVMTMFENSSATATASRNLFVEEPGLFGGGELLEHMKYECATCKRIFKSHQALGGHRASHKKVKGCFARTNDDGLQQQQQQAGEDEVTMLVSEDKLLLRSDEQLDFQDHYSAHHHGHIVPVFVSPTLAATTASAAHHRSHLSFGSLKDDIGGDVYGFNRKQLMKAHECSICHRVFTSGQALGGHKRCHWGGTVDRAGAESQETLAAGGGENRNSTSTSTKLVLKSEAANLVLPQKDELLDLNLPARGQAGEDQVEVEIVTAGFGREFQQENRIMRMSETESAAVAGACAFEQLPRLVPAYTLVKRRKEAAAAKLAMKRASGALNGFHQLGLGQTTVSASTTTTTTTMPTTTMTTQAPASAG